MALTKDEWFKLTVEDIIKPELPICDTHHHLWDHPGDVYLLDNLLADINGGHNIVKTVYVECETMYRKGGPEALQPVGEIEYVLSLTSGKKKLNNREVAAAIVGYADLMLGDRVKPVLEAHLAVGGGKVRGIHVSCSWDPDPTIRRTNPPGTMMTPEFRAGFACLKAYNLSFDAWAYFTQLDDLISLARAFPDTVIITDHMGGLMGVKAYSNRREEIFSLWKGRVADLAACPNVYMKLGGQATTRLGYGWHERAAPPGSAEVASVWTPYFDWCIEQFKVDRCMFESNFPVDRQSCSYNILWNAFKRITAKYSDSEQRALFYGTAARVYRLDS